MNDYYNHNTTTSPERQIPPVIANRLRIVYDGLLLVAQAAENTPDDVSVRNIFQPSHLAAPAVHPAVPAATEQVMGNVIEFPVRTQSLPADTRYMSPTMPLPTQPTQSNEYDPDLMAEMAQHAREQINAI